MAYTMKKARPANRKLYIVELTLEERQMLDELTLSKASMERRKRAQILLKADVGEHSDGGWTDDLIAEVVNCSIKTVGRARKRCVQEGVAATLAPKTQRAPSVVRKLDGRGEAQLIAIACGDPPEGRARWTCRLLADKLVELEVVEAISHKTVWVTLKKMNFSLIEKNIGASHQNRTVTL